MLPTRLHRTQAERSARTRVALLEATIESLAEVGYARTSTTEIVRRAGVSRGAQVHHYPTKADLVVAAVEHLFSRQEQAFVEQFTSLPAGERSLDRAIELLWSIFTGAAYPAALELVVAARTDDDLRVVVQAVGTRFERTVSGLFAELFPNYAGRPFADHLVGFAFAVLQGAAISGYGGFGRPDDAVAMLRSLAHLVTPELLPVLERINDAPEP
ncbi:MAG: TetR/AcrR family transcriptional regulator [Acidimicrobiales bacterium]